MLPYRIMVSLSHANLRTAKQGFVLIVLLFVTCTCLAQSGFGVDVGYASSNAVNMNLKYYKGRHIFSAGGTYQFTGAMGKKVKEQSTGFGRTVRGQGDYFYTADLGYAFKLKPRFSIGGELSLGERSDYTEYADNRFSGGGYHMITRSRFIFGAGVIAAYDIDQLFGVFAGFNTVRSFSVGLQIRFID